MRIFVFGQFLAFITATAALATRASRLQVHTEVWSSAGIDPSINQLKTLVTDQQSKLGALQQELSGILNEITAGKQAFQQSQNNAGPGATVEIQFPAPPPPPAPPGGGTGQAAGGGLAALGSSNILQKMEPPEMLPIPVMVVKPDSVADVEEAMTQVMEEQAAMNGADEAQNSEPQEMMVKGPEQQIEEAIAKIDKLEAEKTHYKYDMHQIQNSFTQSKEKKQTQGTTPPHAGFSVRKTAAVPSRKAQAGASKKHQQQQQQQQQRQQQQQQQQQ